MGVRWRNDAHGRPRAVVGSPLSARELEVARAIVADGDPTNQQVAAALNMSASAVQSKIRDIHTRCGVQTRLSLYKWLVRNGYVDPPQMRRS